LGNHPAITKDGEVIRWPASIHSLKILAPASYPRKVTLPYTSKGYTLGYPEATTAPEGDVARVTRPIYLDGVLTQQWDSRAFTEDELKANKAAADKAAKMEGVEFNGVMYSATKEDQWGLASIKDEVANGIPINYEFENGAILTLSTANWAAFKAVWVPFRQSFFL